MFAENEMTIRVQAIEREFETPVHFIVYNEEMKLIAASILGIETSVKAICAGVSEKRTTKIGRTMLYPLEGRAYRHKTKPMGIGDTVHGMIYSRNSVFNDLFEDEADGLSIKPVIFAPNGNIEEELGYFIRKKFHLTDQFQNWQNKYYYLIPDEKKKNLIVKMNPNYSEIWPNLKVVQIDITKKEIQDIIAENMSVIEYPDNPNALVLTPPKDTFVGEFNPSMTTTKDFVTNRNNLVVLANKMDEIAPHHDPSNPLHWSMRLMGRTPFPVQAHKIQGLANALKTGLRNVFDCGDMGTGKSISMLGTVLLLHEMWKEQGRKRGTSVLLSAPAITLEKWKQKEILPTLPNHAKVEFIRSTEDALRLLKKIRAGHRPHEDDIEFYILGLDRSKLGHDPHFGGVWKRVNGTRNKYSEDGRLLLSEDWSWHCPDCWERLQVPVEKKGRSNNAGEEGQQEESIEYEPAGWFDFVEKGSEPEPSEIEEAREQGHFTKAKLNHQREVKDTYLTANGVPFGAVQKWRTKHKKCHCCKTPLFRAALKNRGETKNRPRYNISRILKKTKKWFDVFVQDEVQQTKAEDSGRGDAFAQMVEASKKQIFLTGTLTTGQSSSIKEILWRSDAKALIDDGFDDKTGTIAWASRYGVIKQVIDVDEEMGGHHTRQRKRKQQPKEEVGISPQLTANHLLHKAAFTELKDLRLPLVELHEIPVVVQQDYEHKLLYHNFHKSLEDVCKKTGNWGPFNPSTLVYGNQPELGGNAQFIDKNSKTGGIITVTAPPLDDGSGKRHAKMRKLIELVKKELSEDRHCIIYTNFTGKYNMNGYVKECLLEEGITSISTLSTNTSSEERFEWLNKQGDKGTQVLITNLSLVEVGLDLMLWPTIFYYEMNWEINKVRQSSRRHWRIGQHRECRTYFLCYDGTTEMKQFKTLMSRRSHALLVEGRLDKSELAEYADDKNALAKDLASCLAGTEIEEKWKKLASKDLDEELEIVSEAEFKDVIAKRMKDLAEETLSLCLPIPETRTLDRLKRFFVDWLSKLSSAAREQIEKHESAVLEAIRHKRIKGFEFDAEKGLWFDIVGTFAFPFVDDCAIVAHIFKAIGVEEKTVEKTVQQNNVIQLPTKKESANKEKTSGISQLDIFDFGVKVKVVEEEEAKKLKGKKSVTAGQLAFELFG